MQYSEKDLANLIASVEKEFMADLAKAEETLAKSETAEAAEAAPAPVEAKEAKEEKEESLAKSEDEDKKEDKDSEDSDYDEKDIEEMHKMYKSMSKKELDHHKAAIEKCGEMKVMAKSEEKVEEKVEEKAEAAPNAELELLKSETSALKTENESLKKSLEALVEGLNKFVKKSAPQGKAIIEVAALAKSEGPAADEKSLSKSEVTAILAKKASDPSLSKSDRERINDFYLNNANIETVSHLLK